MSATADRIEATTSDVTNTRLIERLIAEVKNNDHAERRAEPRHPFFAPVTVEALDGKVVTFSAFSREISKSGIGLLHAMPLPTGEVRLRLKSPEGTNVSLLAEIVWCHSVGEGWYVSGGRFSA